MIGFEQYFVVALGIMVHILLKYAKWQKKNSINDFSFKIWFKENAVLTIASVVITIALVFVLKDFLQFDQVPNGYRNLICLQIGYMGDSIFKDLMNKKIIKE